MNLDRQVHLTVRIWELYLYGLPLLLSAAFIFFEMVNAFSRRVICRHEWIEHRGAHMRHCAKCLAWRAM